MRSPLPDLKHWPGHRRWWFVALVALQADWAGAQALALPPSPELAEAALTLQSSGQLQELIAPEVRRDLPVFVSGERLYGRPDLETVIEGGAQLRKGDIVIQADRLEYYQPDDQARARGQVRVNRAGNVYEGPLLELKLESFEGFFSQPRYYFRNNDAHGEAVRLDFLDEHRTVIRQATLTTCTRQPGPGWLPDWILRASTLRLDNEEEVGTAEGAVLSFMQVPILPIPYLSFPLTEQRKSGLLPPTPGLDDVNGVELALPYYWNIAPNRDATLTPTLMSKRGINLASEFRYLETDYSGQLRLDLMPNDPLRSINRWGLTVNHQANVPNPFDAGSLALSLSLNRVSDDDYWRDFTASSATLKQRLLANDATVSWADGYFSHSVRTLKWQTLQDVASPIIPPYDRLPQLSTRYQRDDLHGYDLSLQSDYTRFQSTSALTGQPDGERAFSVLQVARPFLLPGGFVTPRMQLHATAYQFDTPLASGASAASRVVPTLSLDSGLVFERDADMFGRKLRQTLEPRAFYVHTPYRDQRLLPNYDSGANDFSFATMFTENAFVGNDRIADSNLLTLGLSSRLLDPDTGVESLRFGVAQRLRFSDQNVTLPGGAAVADRLSDLLLGTTITWDPRWAFDTSVQFNAKTELPVRTTAGARYSPGLYRVVSSAYRFQRDISEQVDLGWQWPINDLWGDRGQDLGAGRGQGGGRWYSVGRLNYSLNEGRLVNTLLGLEYDACCWLGRVALERQQTSSTSATSRIMFQLEFVGFTRLGVNPLQTLKANIPGYQLLRESVSSPSRFNNYD
ncbi:MAG: LPS-assembly protein LptD [Betaproteobacteria bacterium]|nr:LPS-assembly protein LptD [Betaproteobacteria bacterium]